MLIEHQPPRRPAPTSATAITTTNTATPFSSSASSSSSTTHHHHRLRSSSAGATQEESLELGGGGRAQKFHRPSECCSFQDTNLSELRRGRRINGLQLPLHPLQVVGWLTLIIFALSTFLVVVPALKPPLHNYILGLLSFLFLVHVCSHLAALLLDPADKELRRLNSDRIVPEFDRVKHQHVIENGRCHLCNIKTSGPRTKHCSVCNKCVGKFDHHCKWLNSCVGSRNYSAFLICVFSSVIATLTIAGLAVTELVLYYYVSPQSLNLWSTEVTVRKFLDESSSSATKTNTTITTATIAASNYSSMSDEDLVPENSTLLLVPANSNATLEGGSPGGFALEDTLFLVFISVVGILATICCALLIHLCFFHIYISFLGLTTYEYIRNQRQQQQQNQNPSQPPSRNINNSNRNNEEIDQRHNSGQSQIPASTGLGKGQHRRGRLKPLKRSSSIERIYLCSTGLKTKSKHSALTRFFAENKVDVVTSGGEEVSSVADDDDHTKDIKSQCVICSLIEIDPRQRKSLVCCGKLYHPTDNIKLGLDVDPEEEEAHQQRVPVATPNKSKWCSKLYCCVNVPDSPDTHLDVCNSLRAPPNGSTANVTGSITPTDNSSVFKITLPIGVGPQPSSIPIARQGRRFRVVDPDRKYNRLRRLFRAVKFQRNVNERIVKGTTKQRESPIAGSALKSNQIRPIISPSNHTTTDPTKPATNATTASTLAPSPRRKIRSRADLKGYIEQLSSNNSGSTATDQQQTAERSPAESFSPPLSGLSGGGGSSGGKNDPTIFSRRARKKTFRNHSPKLSPIKESGLSNPASPAPSRSLVFPAIT